jgi:flagellar motor switch protein FliN
MSTPISDPPGPPPGPPSGDPGDPLDMPGAPGAAPAATPQSPGEVIARMAEFAQLAPETGEGAPTLQFLKDVPVTISARLGQVTLPIADILRLGPGAILELDRDVSQPVELTVRGMTFARGEVVVVDDHFAIRIKELMQPRSTKGKAS